MKKPPPPNMGIVRARDIDVDGVDMAWLMEHLRQLGQRGDVRLNGGGYLIFNRRITTPDFTGWRVYTGTNPHTSHGHVSFTRDPGAFDSTAPWGITTATTVARPQEGFLMALTDAEQREVLEGIRKMKPGLVLPARSKNCRPATDDEYGSSLNAWAEAADARAAVEALTARLGSGTVAAPSGGTFALADADVDRIAARVLDLLSKRTAA
ncbi:hypothetical protein I4I73_21400 [Pseudonocardia sp. KRD-184]|uniref:hypothetical protein n=1 Tax=Pseudonocardia oceani TaxID=2792013 RepID=UPI001C4A3050|nr:hypothetical protein [Pseudonocardia oceani]MBW0090499.1 hypothetical protein [Pseudonocardia oceani]MBW0098548.1 hypothetical protein [Pseudonocardia oceani]MBW0124388.1 hypothetical protein [Pseudonocardia oceani]